MLHTRSTRGVFSAARPCYEPTDRLAVAGRPVCAQQRPQLQSFCPGLAPDRVPATRRQLPGPLASTQAPPIHGLAANLRGKRRKCSRRMCNYRKSNVATQSRISAATSDRCVLLYFHSQCAFYDMPRASCGPRSTSRRAWLPPASAVSRGLGPFGNRSRIAAAGPAAPNIAVGVSLPIEHCCDGMLTRPGAVVVATAERGADRDTGCNCRVLGGFANKASKPRVLRRQPPTHTCKGAQFVSESKTIEHLSNAWSSPVMGQGFGTTASRHAILSMLHRRCFRKGGCRSPADLHSATANNVTQAKSLWTRWARHTEFT